ncbi:MAG TPA: ATP-binding protein [Candidatus Limnocylindrales bacterium]
MAAEAVGLGLRDPSHWLPDLIVGMALITVGLLRLDRPPGGTALLLVVAGGAWLLGTALPAAIYLHRGLLAHATLTFPGWRPNRYSAAGVAAAYASSIVLPLAGSETWTVALSAALVASAWANQVRARGRARVERRVALQATAAFAVILVVSVVIRATIPRGEGVYPALLLYEVGLVAIATYLFAALRSPTGSSVADLVVELGSDSGGSLRARLSSLLGDPSLEIGYWTGDGYVGLQGERIEVPPPGGDRSTTPVSLEERPFAVIVHDRAVLRDRASIEAVTRATRLSSSNVQLRTRVAAAVADIEASSRRLLLATEAERDRLAVRLASGPERTLTTLARSLAAGSRDTRTQREEHLERSRSHVEAALRELRQVARGLRPGEVDAERLIELLEGLATRSPVTVQLDVRVGQVPAEIRATVYYLCAEALTNVAKHAASTSARILVRSDGPKLLVEIADDGRGGADERHGTGLAGMRDRLAAIGGTLAVTSPPNGGTRLVASIPLGDEAR